jgi:hypothetical protein
MVTYQNFAPPSDVRDPDAYVLGRRGVRITADSLLQHLRRFNESYYEERERNLSRRLSGGGVFLHHGVGILAGLGVFLTALFVDYHIVKEFWTWALSNENGELQQALRDSVVFKSLQVVFATMAIHYVLTNIGTAGRGAFSVFIFLLTVMMITGVGLLWATNSLPPGAKLFGVDVHGSADNVNDTLRALGLPAPSAAPASPDAVISQEAIRTYQTVIWLGALSVLFLIVSSVGAMALETAIKGFTGLTGGAIYDDNSVARQSQTMRDELVRVRVERQRLQEDAIAFWRQKIAEFVASYTAGVLSQNFSTAHTQELIDKVNEAAAEAEARIGELT